MSRVLVSFHSPVYDDGFKVICFYDGFIKALEEEGNEVLVVNTSEFLHRSWNNSSNALPVYYNREQIAADTKKFCPDAVIAFNHCIPLEVEEACDCPIVLWDSDAIQFFSDKDYIKRNLDRYTFFCFTEIGVKDALKFGVDKNKAHYVKLATHIKKEEKEIEQNISFIGSTFKDGGRFIQLLEEENIQDLRKVCDGLLGKFYENSDELYKQNGLDHLSKSVRNEVLLSLSSVQNRITALNNLQDLGLMIWGTKDWLMSGDFLPWLAMCYNKDVVYSLKHNQDIYNSSKVCVSIAHSQAIEGYPFRVMDVMASNGCLLSDYHSNLEELTKGYVDLPMFDNPYDARQLAKKLLDDDVWRKDIVLGSQKCVDDNCRWPQRFKQMEELIGVTLRKVESDPQNESAPAPTQYMIKADYITSRYLFFKCIFAIFTAILPRVVLVKIYAFLNKYFGFRVDEQTVGDVKSSSKQIRIAIGSFIKSIKRPH